MGWPLSLSSSSRRSMRSCRPCNRRRNSRMWSRPSSHPSVEAVLLRTAAPSAWRKSRRWSQPSFPPACRRTSDSRRTPSPRAPAASTTRRCSPTRKSSQHNGACEIANAGHDRAPARIGSTIMEANSPLVKPCAAASPSAGAQRSQTCWIAGDCRARRSAHLGSGCCPFFKKHGRKAGRCGAPAPSLLEAVALKVAEVLRHRPFQRFRHTSIAGQPPRGPEIRSGDRSLPARCWQSR